MATEDNTLEITQKLVQELNRLKNAAEMLEEAKQNLDVVRSSFDSRISNLETKVSNDLLALQQQPDEPVMTLTHLREINTQNKKFEDWLKIELKALHERVDHLQKQITQLNTNQADKAGILDNQTKNNQLIWATIAWLGIITLVLALRFLR